ncbi:mitochondria fission 1 protein, partial [Verticillium dahliae]
PPVVIVACPMSTSSFSHMVSELPFVSPKRYPLPRVDLTRSRPLKASELQVLRAQYEKEGDMVGVQTKFNYAWGLVKSDSRNNQQLGVRLLSEIFRVSPERRRECLYYLALGNYKLGNYGEARRYNDLLLEKEPANLQASNLRQLVDDKVAKEGLMGVAIVSGVAVAAGVVGAFLMRNVRKR